MMLRWFHHPDTVLGPAVPQVPSQHIHALGHKVTGLIHWDSSVHANHRCQEHKYWLEIASSSEIQVLKLVYKSMAVTAAECSQISVFTWGKPLWTRAALQLSVSTPARDLLEFNQVSI